MFISSSNSATSSARRNAQLNEQAAKSDDGASLHAYRTTPRQTNSRTG